ncbi:hypothetical protein [Melghirimyces algeriensis]|uniref:Uncharacterized protein n=1 Tax=Melghirimyces algeriensis TaxID=910412 RepID=A0A521F802_9BACL|nr:hypothetical protein [Melghirimyces algeriensis]SMO92332.1 hypothetical protein SAMN06264849_11473 [Melghirimyces algeriensis]
MFLSQMQMPYPYPYDRYPTRPGVDPQMMKETTLRTVEPFVKYGLEEAKKTSYEHAMREIAAMSFLVGRGYDPQNAYRTVESWEVEEGRFY